MTQACRLTVARDGAGAVMLGGAGLAGLAARIRPHLHVAVFGRGRDEGRVVGAARAARETATGGLAELLARS